MRRWGIASRVPIKDSGYVTATETAMGNRQNDARSPFAE
jgi:hypothetical protein